MRPGNYKSKAKSPAFHYERTGAFCVLSRHTAIVGCMSGIPRPDAAFLGFSVRYETLPWGLGS